jgi:hypothetical protein
MFSTTKITGYMRRIPISRNTREKHVIKIEQYNQNTP